MPAYAVSFRHSAEKDLRRLPSSARDRVLKAIKSLATEPRPDGCRKLAGGEGAYRVIYTVDDTVLIVAIERVRHRREVYR
jgi:mRNA interferase RelE/StbE